jgi:hypothetical protein
VFCKIIFSNNLIYRKQLVLFYCTVLNNPLSTKWQHHSRVVQTYWQSNVCLSVGQMFFEPKTCNLFRTFFSFPWFFFLCVLIKTFTQKLLFLLECSLLDALTLIKMTTSVMTLSVITLSIKKSYTTLRMNDSRHNDTPPNHHHAECHFFIVMASFLLVNAIMLSVVVLSVVAPYFAPTWPQHSFSSRQIFMVYL